MNIRRLTVAFGTMLSLLAGMMSMSAQTANAKVAQGPMAKFCKVTFPVIAGYSRISNQLITDNSFRCEKRILGVVNGVGVTVLATHSKTTENGRTVLKSTCIVAYNTSIGMRRTEFNGTYSCEVAQGVQGVTFIAQAGYF